MSYLDKVKFKKKQSPGSKKTKQITRQTKQKAYSGYNSKITAKNKKYKSGSRVKDRMSSATYYASKSQNPEFADHNANMQRKDLAVTGGKNYKLLFNKRKAGGRPLAGGGFSAPLWGGRKSQSEISRSYSPSWVKGNQYNHISNAGNRMKGVKGVSRNKANEYIEQKRRMRTAPIVKPTSTAQSITGKGKKAKKSSATDKMMSFFDLINTGNYAVQGALSGATDAYKYGKGNAWKQRGNLWKGAKKGISEGFKAGTTKDKKGRYTWSDTIMAGDRQTQKRLKDKGYSTSDMMSPLMASRVNKGQIKIGKPIKGRTLKEQRDAERSSAIAGFFTDMAGVGIASSAKAGKLFTGGGKGAKVGNALGRGADLTLDIPVLSLIRGSGKGFKGKVPKGVSTKQVQKVYDSTMKQLSRTHLPKSKAVDDYIVSATKSKLGKKAGERTVRGASIGGIPLLSPSSVRKLADSKYNVPGRALNEAIGKVTQKTRNKALGDNEIYRLVSKEIEKGLGKGTIAKREMIKSPRAILGTPSARNKQLQARVMRPATTDNLLKARSEALEGGLTPLANNSRLLNSTKTKSFSETMQKLHNDLDIGAIPLKSTPTSKTRIVDDSVSKYLKDMKMSDFIKNYDDMNHRLKMKDDAGMPDLAESILRERNKKNGAGYDPMYSSVNLFGRGDRIDRGIDRENFAKFMDYLSSGVSHNKAKKLYDKTGKVTNFDIIAPNGKIKSVPIVNDLGKMPDFESAYNSVVSGVNNTPMPKPKPVKSVSYDDLDSVEKIFKEARAKDSQNQGIKYLNAKLFGGKNVITKKAKNSDIVQMMNYMEDGVGYQRALRKYQETGIPGTFKVRSQSQNGKILEIPLVKNGKITPFEPKYDMMAGSLTDRDHFRKLDLIDKYIGSNPLTKSQAKSLSKQMKSGKINDANMDLWAKNNRMKTIRADMSKELRDMNFKEAEVYLQGKGTPKHIKDLMRGDAKFGKSLGKREMVAPGRQGDGVSVGTFDRAMAEAGNNPVSKFISDRKKAFPKEYKAPSQFELITDRMLKPYDALTREYKAGTTVARSGWHNNNLIQNKALSSYGIGSDVFDTGMKNTAEKVVNRLDPKDVWGKQFGKTFTSKELDEPFKIGGKIQKLSDGATMKTRDFIQAIEQSGLVDSTAMKDYMGKTDKGLGRYLLPSGDKSVFTGGGLHNAIRTESYDKVQHVIAQLSQGKTLGEATESAKKYLFDYDAISKFEEKVMKRIFPFYTYHRKNLPVQAERALENPAQIARYVRNLHGTEKQVADSDEIGRDEWTKGRIQLPGTNMIDPTRGRNVDHAMFLRTGTPYDSLLEAGQGGADKNQLGSLPTYNPLTETAIRYFGTKKDFFGKEFTERDAKEFMQYFNDQYVYPSTGMPGEIVKSKQKRNEQRLSQNEAMQFLKLFGGINAKYYKSPQEYKNMPKDNKDYKKKQVTLKSKYK